MSNVNAAYIESLEFAENPEQAQSSSFFRSLLAMAALDVLMLFWMLNPLSRPAKSLPVWHRASAPHAQEIGSVVKPSPLGEIARQVNSSKTAVTKSARNSAISDRRFVTVAYRQ